MKFLIPVLISFFPSLFATPAIAEDVQCASQTLEKTVKVCYYDFGAPGSSFKQEELSYGCRVSYFYPYSSYEFVTLTILNTNCEIITRSYQRDFNTEGHTFSSYVPLLSGTVYPGYCKGLYDPSTKLVQAAVDAQYARMLANQCK